MRVSVKTVILALVSLFFINLVATSAFALPDIDSEAEAAKVDDLELSQEVETLEAYGEAAGAKTNAEETARLKAESRSLEKKIANLQRSNESSKKRAVKLAQAYREKDRLANKLKRLADGREREYNRLQARNQQLSARVQSAEQRVIRQVERRKAAEEGLAKAERDNRELEGRRRIALQKFKREQDRTQRARKKANYYTRRNDNYGPDVATLQ